MQETCKSPFSLRPNVPADKLPQLGREELQKTATAHSCSPCDSPETLQHHFRTKRAEQRIIKPLTMTTQQDPSIFPATKVLLFSWALRRCLPYEFSISLASLPYGGKKNPKQKEEGINLHTRGTKSSASSTLTSSSWIPTTRTSPLI